MYGKNIDKSQIEKAWRNPALKKETLQSVISTYLSHMKTTCLTQCTRFNR